MLVRSDGASPVDLGRERAQLFEHELLGAMRVMPDECDGFAANPIVNMTPLVLSCSTVPPWKMPLSFMLCTVASVLSNFGMPA